VGSPLPATTLAPADVRALVARLDRLDVLVTNVWGGDRLTNWDAPFWEHDLQDGLEMQRHAVGAHIITAHAAVPLMVARGSGLVVEVTDGVGDRYRGSLFYDLAKASAIRLATAMDAELRDRGVTAVAISPGFLRSEAMLDHFGVTADTWRDGIAKDRHFAQSETPRFVGRAVAALAADPDKARWAGRTLGSWDLARDYGFTDVDGARPDWGTYFATL
jgi:NAD(P)-dependent dehydrogenase (short-subunit alcohol dehydrogenase family)